MSIEEILYFFEKIVLILWDHVFACWDRASTEARQKKKIEQARKRQT
jgi:hypothetical protein